MQFLRTLFWVVLAAVAAVFATRNWSNVEVVLWGGLTADVKLPVLVLAAFLLGLLPTLAVQRARQWQLKRKLAEAERALEPPLELGVPTSPAPAAASPAAAPLIRTGGDPIPLGTPDAP